jgi:hypothetical protein
MGSTSQTKLGIEGKPMYYLQVDAIRKLRPANKLDAKAMLWQVFTKEITRLQDLKREHLDPLAIADKAGAKDRAMFDDSKEAVLLRRYETACEREFHKSIADLMKLRKTPILREPEPEPAPEPVADPKPWVISELVPCEAVTVEELAAVRPLRNEANPAPRSNPNRPSEAAQGVEKQAPTDAG